MVTITSDLEILVTPSDPGVIIEPVGARFKQIREKSGLYKIEGLSVSNAKTGYKYQLIF